MLCILLAAFAVSSLPLAEEGSGELSPPAFPWIPVLLCQGLPYLASDGEKGDIDFSNLWLYSLCNGSAQTCVKHLQSPLESHRREFNCTWLKWVQCFSELAHFVLMWHINESTLERETQPGNNFTQAELLFHNFLSPFLFYPLNKIKGTTKKRIFLSHRKNNYIFKNVTNIYLSF